MKAFKNGVRVPLGKYLRPNNGLNSHQTFYDAVRQSINFEPSCDVLLQKMADALSAHVTSPDSECCRNTDKEKKIGFLAHQLQLLTKKMYTVQDYCFALESFPNCKYEDLREFLVLPSKRKLQSIVSSVDVDSVMKKYLNK